MALVRLDILNSLQMLELVLDPDRVKEHIRQHRIVEGIPPDAKETTAETIWITYLASRAMAVFEVLSESKPFELADLWDKHTKRKRGKGKPQWTSHLYDLAHSHKKATGKSLMEVFHDMVLPMLITSGKITIEETGDPNQEQKEAAIKAYLNAMSKKHRRE